MKLVLLVASLALVTPVLAQAPETASPEEEAIARAVALRRAGRDDDALRLLRDLHDARPTPRVLAQLALAEQATGAWLDAAEHLDRALDADDVWITEHRDVLEAARVEIGAHLGQLDVVTDAPSAWVRVNGGERRPLPLDAPLRVVAGDTVVEVGAEDHHAISRVVQVPGGGRARERFTLVPASRDVTAPSGRHPGRVDGSAGRRARGWGILGVGAALVVGGGVGVAVRNVAIRDFNADACARVDGLSRDEECPELRPRWRRAGATGWVLIGVGAVAALGGLVLGIRDLRVRVGPTSVSVALRFP